MSTPEIDEMREQQAGGDQAEGQDEQTDQVLSEGRMILPGLLSLLGLQMMAVFNNVFHDRLAAWEQLLHAVALALLVLGVGIVLTPAAYHRMVSPCHIPADFPRLASRFMVAGMVPLMLVLVIDLYLGTRLAFASPVPSAVLAGALFVVLLGLWFVFPLVMRRRHAG